LWIRWVAVAGALRLYSTGKGDRYTLGDHPSDTGLMTLETARVRGQQGQVFYMTVQSSPSVESLVTEDNQHIDGAETRRNGRRSPRESDAGDRAEITALVKAASAGDHAAWNALVDRFASTVWAIARAHRLNAADAADVSQTTWLRLLEHLDRIQQPERVGAWLATTARRESLRVLRVAGRQIPNGDDFDVLPDSVSSTAPDRGLMRSERVQLVTELVEKLPVRSQLLLRLLSADSPLSYRDISEALAMPIGSIGPTRARALEQLRKLAVGAGYQLEDVFA
jgi:RNA polymerase sigma factor (sigma-70 family)